MEDAYKAGKLRAVGVANFLEDNFRRLIDTCTVIPAVNQVETHIFKQQKGLCKLLDETGTIHESWSPIACGRNGFFRNPVLIRLSEKYGKTATMTEGAPWKHILKFSLPVLAGSLLQQLHNTVDTIIVGRYASEDAL